MMKVLIVVLLLVSTSQSKVARAEVSKYNYQGNRPLSLKGGKPMELILALAGLGGVAAYLLQSKSPLPSEADYKKALEKLKDTPTDPDANTIAGKYVAFVLGDYAGGMKFLVNSNDKTLRTLAEHEMAPLYADTAPKKIGMGDEWVAAGKGFPALSRIFYDRASQWYTSAWPDLDPVWKERSRAQGMKLAASRPPGVGKRSLPGGWSMDQAPPGARSPVLDGSIAHAGSYSVKMMPPDEKVKDGFSQLKSDLMAIPPGKELEFSAMVFSNGTENANDRLVLYIIDKTAGSVYIPLDLPFWNRVSGKINIPDGSARMMLGVIQASKKGNIWVDDLSVKVDGKEVLKNPSFEQ